MNRQRLETTFETRVTGWQINKETGLPEPVQTRYHIGHGQQLARRRLNDRRAELKARYADVILDAGRQNVLKNLPGETNRQLAARLRAETATTEAPAKPKRVRTKKAAA